MITRAIKFITIFVLLYVISVLVMSHVGVGSSTLMKIATRNPVKPGGFGFTLQRFQDVKNYRNIDILFIGSSHCYRTFDPRIYAEYGLETFNMGTTGQSPINSYYLLKRYFDHLNPRLVVFDLNYRVIDRDGLESFYDLVANIPYSSEFMEMALEINSPHAINAAFSKMLVSMTGTSPEYRQEPREGEAYIPGGYVEFTKPDQNAKPFQKKLVDQKVSKYKPRRVVPLDEQLEHIVKIIRFVRSKNAKIVLITKPEPQYNLNAIANYDEISQVFANIAARENVDYIDFNQIALPLNAGEHFHDKEYLSPAGVKVFNPILIKYLSQRKIIDWQVEPPLMN